MCLVKEQIAKFIALGNVSEDHAANKTVTNEFSDRELRPLILNIDMHENRLIN